MKKHDKHDVEELVIPPPPVDVPIPQPMETLEDQVYERPWERRHRGEENGNMVDIDRTPKVRRKQKSVGDIAMEKRGMPPKEQIFSNAIQEQLDFKPSSNYSVEPDPMTNKTTSKDIPKSGLTPFERPEPMASPRPPRMTPSQQTEREVGFITSLSEPTTSGTRSEKCPISSESIPPPLPEKKSKSVGVAKLQDATKSKQVENLTVQYEKPELATMQVPDKEKATSKQTNIEVKSSLETEISLDPQFLPETKESSLVSALKTTDTSTLKNELCENRYVGNPSEETLMSSCDHVNAQSADIPTVISPVDNALADNCSIINNYSALVPSDVVEQEISVTKSEQKDLASSVERDSDPGRISSKPEPIVTIPLVDSSIQQSAVINPVEVNPSPQECDFPKYNECIPKNQVPAEPSVVDKGEISSIAPIVKPFPLTSIALKNLDKEDDSNIVKPPWVKPLQKESECIESKKTKEPVQPSINNLPKLVMNKTNDSEESPKQQLRGKPEQTKQSINNLPKLKIDKKHEFASSETFDDCNENAETPSPRTDLPLVVPFPGKVKDTGNLISPPIQLAKQDSPKSLFNNIPKPFKSDNDKDLKEIKSSVQVTINPKEVVKEAIPALATRPIISHPPKVSKSTDSVGSCISLSDDEDHKQHQNSPLILPKPNGPNINYATLSPSNSGSNLDNSNKKNSDKRDSKVIKAAAYWNNYIGEVTSKSKPPSNPKSYEKPKKIVSAGIGERGLKELTSAFEMGKPIQPEDKYTILRRNSKKMSVDSCNPGLRVNDAKSVFEKKFQPTETPRLVRRASSSLEKPKWGPAKDTNGKESLDSMNGQASSSSPSEINERETSKSPVAKSEKVKYREKSKSPVAKIEKVKSPAPERKKNDKILNAKSPVPEKPTILKNSDIQIIENGKSEILITKNLKTPLVATTLMDQPKPPTSPKPKVRKEDLKMKEDLAKSKEGSTQLTKKTADNLMLIAPLQTKEKEYGETAVIKKLKDVEVCTESPNKVVLQPVQQEAFNDKESIIALSKHNTIEALQVEKYTSDTVGKSKDDTVSPTKVDTGTTENENKAAVNINQKLDLPLIKESEVPKLLIGIHKIKSPEPEKPDQIKSPEPNLSELRNNLKKVPHSAVSRRKSCNENETIPLEAVHFPSETKLPGKEELSGSNIEKTKTNVNEIIPQCLDSASVNKEDDVASPKERIIPIQLVNENRNRGPKPFKLEVDSSAFKSSIKKEEESTRKSEHYIPILVEGQDSFGKTGDIMEEEREKTECMDNFNASSISRRRWGSRKKRMSSAFSDSSVSDDDALSTPFGGLQKYSSYGKHGLEEPPSYRLKKTRPPFSVERTDSFSSGEDDFDDDGFQEMTAENLFSTLLSRVKSLTRRIHDEHDEHLNWQRAQRHGPPKLNPGGTHARLERTAQRNSIKRTGDSTPSFSRQSSTYDDSASQKSYNDSSSPRSYNSAYTPTRIYNRSISSNAESDSRYSTGSRYSTSMAKRYDELDAANDYSSSISITSSQRLRPGYLPPPANINTMYASDPNTATHKSNDVDAQLTAQYLTSKAQESSERNIPINIQKNKYDSPVSSKPGTPLPMPGVYMKHMKPFSSSHANDSHNRLESPEPTNEGGEKQRRVSRFLRPDFYDIPKEDSIYAKMKELEDEDKKKPRFLRVVHPRTRDNVSGRSTPLDFPSYSDDGIKTDSTNIQHDLAAPVSEGQFLPRTLILKSHMSLIEPSTQISVANTISSPPSNPHQCFPTSCLVHSPETAPPTAETSKQKLRRIIYPYTGAKSDGQLLNKHAHVSLNIIAAAERKKRQSYFQQADADPSQEKVMATSSVSCTFLN